MLTDDDHVLTYGKSLKENKARFPNLKVREYNRGSMIIIEFLGITEYAFDCSSVIFHHCSRASDKDITDAIDFCSFNGFDKIFHTHTSYNADYYYAFKERLIKLGFTYINARKSNRNPDHFCGIFVYHIPKCESIGYNF